MTEHNYQHPDTFVWPEDVDAQFPGSSDGTYEATTHMAKIPRGAGELGKTALARMARVAP